MNAPTGILVTPHRYRLLVDDFLALNERGAFDEFAKSELIDGDVYVMNAQHAGHAPIKSRLARHIGNLLDDAGSDYDAMVEVTVRTGDDGAPEPDIVVTRWHEGGIVPVETVALAIEVSDTTLDIDLGRKARLYAAAGVPEYWVVDTNGRRTWLHTRPERGEYAVRNEVAFGATLIAATIPGLSLSNPRIFD